MRLVPVPAAAGFDDEGHRELAMRCAGAFHDGLDDPRGFVDLRFRHLEQQLVVDLQQHAGTQPFAEEGSGDTGHGALDDVGRQPCRGALMACRSAPARRAGLASRIPGMKHLRPKIVST
jgi:hypothetical protein